MKNQAATLIRFLRSIDTAPAQVTVCNVSASLKDRAAAYAKANPSPRAIYLLG